MFPEDADVKAVAGGDVRSVRIPRAARQGRAAQNRFQARHSARCQLSHPLPFARAERRPEDARNARAGARNRRSTPSSAAPATTAPGASRTEFFAQSMKIGRPVFRQMARDRSGLRELRLPDRRPPYPAGHRRNRDAAARSIRLTLLRIAYGLVSDDTQDSQMSRHRSPTA